VGDLEAQELVVQEVRVVVLEVELVEEAEAEVQVELVEALEATTLHQQIPIQTLLLPLIIILAILQFQTLLLSPISLPTVLYPHLAPTQMYRLLREDPSSKMLQ
jgi:hypothetical protein